jgi:Bacterial Ig domain
MTFGLIFFIVAIAFLSVGKPAYAIECIVIGPRYGLTSDMVNWSVKIRSGQSCTRSLRFDNVAIESLELVSPPQTGKVTLQGPSFTYSARSEYKGEDSFTVAVSGTINRSRGSSTIRIIVSVGNPASAAIYQNRTPGPIAAPKPLVATQVDNNLPLPDKGSLLPCPRWDWSKGSPPPMRPPFDRSKLYCPPPPFKPPSQPVGCRCEE